ncbi:hypothetical protein HU200_022010 [Digitaria exilis]|uniref:BTB domain-containing protein n=1 Tax=Digitaria exilis TaxID=1010633 RepID=A0A835EY45_9POAL|nr:hypothetical protein HU200_022010 [Digitaria exilis]
MWQGPGRVLRGDESKVVPHVGGFLGEVASAFLGLYHTGLLREWWDDRPRERRSPPLPLSHRLCLAISDRCQLMDEARTIWIFSSFPIRQSPNLALLHVRWHRAPTYKDGPISPAPVPIHPYPNANVVTPTTKSCGATMSSIHHVHRSQAQRPIHHYHRNKSMDAPPPPSRLTLVLTVTPTPSWSDEAATPVLAMVPPPDKFDHYDTLFPSEDNSYVKFVDDGDKFNAHRYLLVVQYSVF